MRYAGIGSRKTPRTILRVMEDFAAYAGPHSTLLSGGAAGADQAFEFGARVLGHGRVETYLPWPGFENILDPTLDKPSQAAMEIAEEFHPGWRYLSQGAKKLIARDGHQVLGKDLLSPVDLVVCWTKDGSVDGSERSSGGTGQALRIAKSHDIAVLNLKRQEHLEEIIETMRKP